MRVACLLFSQEVPLEGIAEACLRFTPQMALRSPEALFLEVGKCRRLYREEGLLLRLQALVLRFTEAPVRISLADDVPTALACARFDVTKKTSLPVDALADYMCPFSRQDEALKKSRNIAEKLKRLGLYFLKDLVKLPRKSLVSRFGFEALEACEWFEKANEFYWPRFIPPEKVKEDIILNDEVQSLEPLMFILKGAVDRCMAKLMARGLRASALTLVIHLEKFSTVRRPKRQWVFQFSLPQGATSSVLSVLKERLSSELEQDPLEAPIVDLSIVINETAPRLEPQKHFWSHHEETMEAWNSLLGRLEDKLGKDKAYLASPVATYRPESAWKKTLKELGSVEEAFSESLPLRPLRLFKKPMPLEKRQFLLVGAMGRSWVMTGWDGPEKLSGEWWKKEFERDYFRVSTQTGEELWVFYSRSSQQLYLHGIFD